MTHIYKRYTIKNPLDAMMGIPSETWASTIRNLVDAQFEYYIDPVTRQFILKTDNRPRDCLALGIEWIEIEDGRVTL